MAIAIVALIIGLTGTGVAVYTLPRNSVGTTQIKKGAVTNTRLGNNSVGTKRIKNNAVTSLKIRNRTIREADLSWDLWEEILLIQLKGQRIADGLGKEQETDQVGDVDHWG